MVRSFAWAGILWEDQGVDDSDISWEDGSVLFGLSLLFEEATLAAECWPVIRGEWPREAGDREIATRSKF